MRLDQLQAKAIRGVRRAVSFAVPSRYQIPLRFRLHMWEDCETELQYLDQIGPNEGTAVDIGANVGLFAYHMAQWYDEVYAFEVNEALTKLLEAFDADNIHVINKGCSSRTGQATLHIPSVRDEALTGWATLDPETYPSVQTYIQKDVKVCRLDDYELQEVGLIKIDVEGHELDVIKGAEATITRSRPHVIAEIKPQHVNAIWRFFAERNYDMTRAEHLIGVPSKSSNYIFVPQ